MKLLYFAALLYLFTLHLYAGKLEEFKEELKKINAELNSPLPETDANHTLLNRIIKCSFLQQQLEQDKERYKEYLEPSMIEEGKLKPNKLNLKFDTLERNLGSRKQSLTESLIPFIDNSNENPFFIFLEEELNSGDRENRIPAALMTIQFIIDYVPLAIQKNAFFAGLAQRATQLSHSKD